MKAKIEEGGIKMSKECRIAEAKWSPADGCWKYRLKDVAGEGPVGGGAETWYKERLLSFA